MLLFEYLTYFGSNNLIINYLNKEDLIAHGRNKALVSYCLKTIFILRKII